MVRRTAQAPAFEFNFHFRDRLRWGWSVRNVIEVGLYGRLLVVGHQLDDDRLAIGKNLVVLRAVQIDDHARGGRIRAEAGDAKTFYFTLIEQLGVQIAGWLGIWKIEDKAIRVGDYLTAQSHGLAGGDLNTYAAGGGRDLHTLDRCQGFRCRRRHGANRGDRSGDRKHAYYPGMAKVAHQHSHFDSSSPREGWPLLWSF